MTLQTMYLASLSAGIIFLVTALGAARWNWRKNIPPFGLTTKVIDVLRHPDRYTHPRAFRLVRVLGLVGSLFLVLAIAVIICQIAILMR